MKIESEPIQGTGSSNLKERYVDIRKVSTYTSLPVSTLYEWASTGRMPSIKIGRRVLFDLQDIDKIMESMKRTCNKEEEIANKILGDLNGN
jgi:excisionase family DNA binding protein